MLHDGEMRRSEDEFEEATMMGISAAVWKDMLVQKLAEPEPVLKLARTAGFGGKEKL